MVEHPSKGSGTEGPEEHEEPIVRDKRRVDPVTGKVRRPESSASDDAERLEHEQIVDTGEGFEGPDVETSLSDADLDFLSGQSDAEDLAAERLADLQRVTAEYANYRKRTEANREVERERAVMDAVKVLLPVLDDLDRAEKHGDLEGESAFTTIAAKLRSGAEKLGLKPFGEKGEPFDHNVHEAIFQQPSPDVDADTVLEVVETGYTLGSTLVRAAKVVVAVPES
ncbi:MAG TPA: nucleotide exchange factor GrpE [Humibacter sp.]|nr:nucleotide exchange factor GrpE [Humibacter sp.]